MMIVHNCEQGGIEWKGLRRGIPTASHAEVICTPAKRVMGSGARTYAFKLAAEFGPQYWYQDDVQTAAMKRGLRMEPRARKYYRFYRDLEAADCEQVGFVTTDDRRFGYSPDMLPGSGGIYEGKYPDAHTHLQWLYGGVVPAKHLPQCHWGLIVTGRKWCDFHSHYDGFAPLIVRIERDDYTEALRENMEKFWTLYQEIKQQLGEYTVKNECPVQQITQVAGEPVGATEIPF